MKKYFQRDVLIDAIYEAAVKDSSIFILSADFGAPALDRFRTDLSQQFFHLGLILRQNHHGYRFRPPK